LRWASHHPENLLSLIISDTIYTDQVWHSFAKLLRTPNVGEKVINNISIRENWNSSMKQIMPGVEDDVLEDFYELLKTEDSRSVDLELYRSGDLEKLEPYRGKLRNIKRVTIIWGENDPYIPSDYASHLKDTEFPNAHVFVIPNIGHFVQIEAPDKVMLILSHHFS
jgi:pimeloyl-ACP methyl ester carboxylesterase